MERKAAQQNRNTSEEIKQGLPRHSSQGVTQIINSYLANSE